jgi:hypothetical protein
LKKKIKSINHANLAINKNRTINQKTNWFTIANYFGGKSNQ